MKLSCEIVRDLLPLYEDKVCSEKSRIAVEEHLSECKDCRSILGAELHIPELHTENNAVDERVIKRGFKKIRCRWSLSLIAVLLVIPVILLSINQFRGRGICYTNVDDMITAGRFMKAVEKGDFKRSADMIECESLYYTVQDILRWGIDEYIGDYQTIEIDGKQCVISSSLYNEYIKNYSEENIEENIWDVMVLEMGTTVIPCGEWNRIVSEYPELIEVNSRNRYTLNFRTYELMNTQWGEFYVHIYSNIDEESPLIELFYGLSIADADMYNEVKPMLEKQAQEEYDFNQKYYGEAKDMTITEFEDFIRKDWEKSMKNWTENGYSLKNISLNGCRYSERDKSWVITFDAEITKASKVYDASLSISVHNGKISVTDMKTDNEYADQSFYNAFMTDYPGAV